MRIHAIKTGTVAVKARQIAGVGPGPVRPLLTLLDAHWTEPMPIWAWVIEHPDGLIVVDSGETSRVKEPGYFAGHPYFRFGVREWVDPADEIGPQLQRLGLDSRDVRYLVLTHLHTDHAGGLYHFPESTILLSRTEYSRASGAAGRRRGYLPQHWPTWFAPRLVDWSERPEGPFTQSMPLTASGDVILVATPGHTPGHLSVIVRDGKETLFLAGDTSYDEAMLLEGKIDGVTGNVRQGRRTNQQICTFLQAENAIYLPSHDPAADRRLLQRTPSRVAAPIGIPVPAGIRA